MAKRMDRRRLLERCLEQMHTEVCSQWHHWYTPRNGEIHVVEPNEQERRGKCEERTPFGSLRDFLRPQAQLVLRVLLVMTGSLGLDGPGRLLAATTMHGLAAVPKALEPCSRGRLHLGVWFLPLLIILLLGVRKVVDGHLLQVRKVADAPIAER
jgi:hypothetical protein